MENSQFKLFSFWIAGQLCKATQFISKPLSGYNNHYRNINNINSLVVPRGGVTYINKINGLQKCGTLVFIDAC